MNNRIYLLFAVSVIVGCVGSRPYNPLPWEAALYKEYSKYPFPNEIIPENDGGKNIHWLGVIDSFWVDGNDSLSILCVLAQHKYWDYIEDFGSQREKMFVSPLGAGAFIYKKEIQRIPIDSTKKKLSVIGKKENIGMFYGKYNISQNGIPILDGNRVRFIPKQCYSTQIWSYEIKKDSTGSYNLENFQTLN